MILGKTFLSHDAGIEPVNNKNEKLYTIKNINNKSTNDFAKLLNNPTIRQNIFINSNIPQKTDISILHGTGFIQPIIQYTNVYDEINIRDMRPDYIKNTPFPELMKDTITIVTDFYININWSNEAVLESIITNMLNVNNPIQFRNSKYHSMLSNKIKYNSPYSGYIRHTTHIDLQHLENNNLLYIPQYNFTIVKGAIPGELVNPTFNVDTSKLPTLINNKKTFIELEYIENPENQTGKTKYILVGDTAIGVNPIVSERPQGMYMTVKDDTGVMYSRKPDKSSVYDSYQEAMDILTGRHIDKQITLTKTKLELGKLDVEVNKILEERYRLDQNNVNQQHAYMFQLEKGNQELSRIKLDNQFQMEKLKMENKVHEEKISREMKLEEVRKEREIENERIRKEKEAERLRQEARKEDLVYEREQRKLKKEKKIAKSQYKAYKVKKKSENDKSSSDAGIKTLGLITGLVGLAGLIYKSRS